MHPAFSLRHNTHTMRISGSLRRPQAGFDLAFALALGAAIAISGTLLQRGGTVAAQVPNACGLLTTDEIHTLAPKEHVSDGLASATGDFISCRYTWGAGSQRFTLAVSVNSGSHMYIGMAADSIKQGLTSSVVPGTIDATIPDLGEAAVFKAYSPMYVSANAYLKGRVLQINLDGFDALEKKEQLISLLKSAAARL